MKVKLTGLILILLMVGTLGCGNSGIDNGVSSTIDTQSQQSDLDNGRTGDMTHPIPE